MVANSGLRESKGRGRNHWEREKGEGEITEREEREREMWEIELREWKSQEQMREKMNKIIFLFLQLSYSAIAL